MARVPEPGCWIKGSGISLILVHYAGNPQEASAAEYRSQLMKGSIVL